MNNNIYAIAETQTELSPAPQISAELFRRWTDYIDGSERTKATYTANIKRFSDWLTVNQISHPERVDVIRYRDELKAAYKPATVHGYLVAVKLYLSLSRS